MQIEQLKNFGMTRVEATVYLELSRFRECKIGTIINRTGLHRGTVYNAISNLMKKGYLSFVDKEGSRHYRLSGKNIFRDNIKRKKEQLESEMEKVNRFFDEIEKMRAADDTQEVQTFYGIEAFKSLFLEIFYYCSKRNIEYLFQGMGGEMMQATGEGFYKYTQEKKRQMAVRCRVILAKETKKMKYHRYTHGNIRYLPTRIKSPINFWIYDKYLLMVLFGTEPLVSIKVRSSNLSDGFRNYFENLWKISESNNIQLQGKQTLA